MDKFELVIVAITPCIALALGIYLSDRYEKEPFKYLVLIFIMGCLSTFPSIFFENLLVRMNIFSGVFRHIFTAFIVIALVEEIVKRGVVFYSVYHSPVFSEPLDGIIYCAFSALGFATIENIIYVVFRYPFMPEIGFYRAFLSVPTHVLYAITMGFYLGKSKFCLDAKMAKVYRRKSLIVPVIMHGVFDFILMVYIPLSRYVFFVYMLFLWGINLYRLHLFVKDSKLRRELK